MQAIVKHYSSLTEWDNTFSWGEVKALLTTSLSALLILADSALADIELGVLHLCQYLFTLSLEMHFHMWTLSFFINTQKGQPQSFLIPSVFHSTLLPKLINNFFFPPAISMSFPLLFSSDQLILFEAEGHYPEVISWVLNRWYMSPVWWRNTLFMVGSISISISVLELFSIFSSLLLLISSTLLCSQLPPPFPRYPLIMSNC